MAAAWALQVCCGIAMAQPQALREMDHRAWTVRDGAPQVISALALDRRDGTLWIGSDSGLFNFDGLSFRPFQSPSGQPAFPNGQVSSLLVTRGGTIWVGVYESGVARVSGDQVTIFNTIGAEPLTLVEHLQEAPDGTVWATGDRRLIRFGQGDAGWRREAAPPSTGVSGFLVDSTLTLWLAQDGVLYRRPLAQPSYERTGVPADAIIDFVETPGGEIWINDYDVATARGRTQVVNRDGQRVRLFQPNAFTEGRTAWATDGSLILASSRDGLRRIPPHASPLLSENLTRVEPDVFLRDHGLSSNTTRALTIDAHGNIWIGGLRGLDRLKPARLTRHSPGAEASGWAVCGSHAGEVWVANTRGDLYPVFTNAPPLRAGGSPLYSIACADDGRAWFANSLGVWAIASGTVRALPPIGGGIGRQPIRVLAAADHTLYAAVAASSFHHDGGIWRFRNGTWTQLPRDGELGLGGYSAYLDRQDRLWIGYTNGRAMVHTAAGARMLASGEPGLGHVHAFIDTPRGVFAAGANGVAVLRPSGFDMLSFAEPLFARGVRGLVEARNGDLWLNSASGFTQVPAGELDAALARADHRIKARLIREGDISGAGAPQGVITYLDTAARDAGGRLWFATRDGVVHLDPEGGTGGGAAPIVTIRSMRADGQEVAGDRVIGPAVRSLDIGYVGVNLSAPEHVVYRYRLGGLDESWQDAGRRTEVVYTRLPPGTYTFSVMASNGDGVWTDPVSAPPFTVRPSFYQTPLFLAATLGLAILGVVVVHRLRVQQVSRVMNARFDERTRVARELHDTILQTVHGSRIVAELALKDPADHPRMVQTMRQVAAWLTRAADEGRTALNVLRGTPPEANNLTEAIRRAIDECRTQWPAAISLDISGEPREMLATVQDEIYRIAHEAIRNACAHSGGDRIDVRIVHAADFTLEVRDNGEGIAAGTVEKGRMGHFGLRGMQERAERIGGRLGILASPGTGTTVTLVVPGSRTYRKL